MEQARFVIRYGDDEDIQEVEENKVTLDGSPPTPECTGPSSAEQQPNIDEGAARGGGAEQEPNIDEGAARGGGDEQEPNIEEGAGSTGVEQQPLIGESEATCSQQLTEEQVVRQRRLQQLNPPLEVSFEDVEELTGIRRYWHSVWSIFTLGMWNMMGRLADIQESTEPESSPSNRSQSQGDTSQTGLSAPDTPSEANTEETQDQSEAKSPETQDIAVDCGACERKEKALHQSRFSLKSSLIIALIISVCLMILIFAFNFSRIIEYFRDLIEKN